MKTADIKTKNFFTNDSMGGRLFFKLLPVQILLIAMTSINSLVDGAVAGRFIDATTVGVVGMFFTFLGIIGALSSTLLGGSAVLSGRHMGEGDIEKTSGVFSLTMTLGAGIGIIATAIVFLFPGSVASFCGANEELRGLLSEYAVGYAIGLFPMVLSQQLAAFLQLERQSTRNYIGIVAMIVFNIICNIVFVAVFNLGIFGLALSTSMCNWIYFFILVSYYFTGKAQLKYNFGNIPWKETIEIIKIGSPGALMTYSLSLRDVVLNRIILFYGGSEAMSAKSSQSMVAGLFLALCIGGGATVRTLVSVYVGEEDKDAIKDLLKLVFTKLMLMVIASALVVIAISGPVISIFFPDAASLQYKYAQQYFMVFNICIPLVMISQVESAYLQARGQNACVNAISFIDGFASVVVPAILLAPLLGMWGVWIATPIGIVITMLVYPVYAIIFWKRIPRNLDEWLLIRDDFGVTDDNRLVMHINDASDVVQTSSKVQEFCLQHGMSKKKAMYSAICLEEMARNVVEHGFKADKKKHFLDARVVFKDEKTILRIKDDCKAFDPEEMAQNLNSDDPTKNIGIRLVFKLADEKMYRNLLGLNVMTITMCDKD